jgi:hypothetical protein
LQVADWQGFVPELFRKGQPFVAVAKRSAIRKDFIERGARLIMVVTGFEEVINLSSIFSIFY